MAKVKQSDVAFLMMKDWYEQFMFLSDEQTGKLIKAIYKYQCDGTDFDTDDPTLKVLWLCIRRVFNINNEKYLETCAKRRESANIRWQNNANASNCIFSDAKDADIDIDIDIDTDTDTETDIETDIEIEKETVTEKEAEADTDCTSAAANNDLRLIKSRFDELVGEPYFQTAEMQSPDYRCKKLTLGEMIALHEFVDETALERYFIKVNDYRTDNAAEMILRWAVQDGTVAAHSPSP